MRRRDRPERMTTILHLLLAVVGTLIVGGTLLNFSKHPHWFVRLWDFPRVFVAAVAAAVGVTYLALFRETAWDVAAIVGLGFVVVRQLYLVWPYTPLGKKAVVRSDKPPGPDSFRLLISNVLMENEEHDRWLRVVRQADPDVVVAVEVNARWDAAIAALAADYPHCVRRPQENYYGMAIYSRLAFDGEPDVRFVVQDDVPSAHLTLRLRDGQKVRLHALHPRPPEPIRGQDSAPRDAELVTVGKEIGEHERDVPTVVCGDLNDVAWSYTTQLFLRLSGLLDPRRGRGTFNSFNAKSRIFRFPLDHVFHSNEFKLLDLKVLPYVGSDHFPMLIELSCQPEAARRTQGESTTEPGDQEAAAEMVEAQAEREADGTEHGHVGGQRQGGGKHD
jgi:endonuclease/exonuclease/phosphatase (EEP) superfamily protein YafD